LPGKRPADRASTRAHSDNYIDELDQLCRLAETLGTTLDARVMVKQALEPLLAMTGSTGALVALALPEALPEDGMLTEVASLECALESPVPLADVASLGDEARGFADRSQLPGALAAAMGELDGPLAVTPLRAHSRLLGAVILSRPGWPFEVPTLKLLSAAGRILALAVENSTLFEDLQSSYRRLMDAQQDLIRSERLAALGQLSATLAHEIRNPLATIFSAISQIRKHGRPNEMLGTLLDIAEEEAVRLNNMVSGLLDFARPRKPVFEDGRPRSIAEEVVRVFVEGGSVPDGAEISMAPDCQDPTTRLDTELIHKALTLLVTNAIQAVESEGQRISIRVRRPDDLGHGAIIEVEDDGPGIATEEQKKILEPFYSTNPSGTGLGLPTVKRIAEDHGGSLEIVSRPGTGTTIRMLIPGGIEGPPDEEVR
jgi:signal transduction histidine kinase